MSSLSKGFQNYIDSVAKHNNIPFKKLSNMSQDSCQVSHWFQLINAQPNFSSLPCAPTFLFIVAPSSLRICFHYFRVTSLEQLNLAEFTGKNQGQRRMKPTIKRLHLFRLIWNQRSIIAQFRFYLFLSKIDQISFFIEEYM